MEKRGSPDESDAAVLLPVLGSSSSSVVVRGSKDEQDEDMFSSSASSGGCIPGEDVMMNHVILKHMFDLCGSGQLNNFRRVCKHWYKTSLPAWLRAGPAKKFKSEKELRSFLAQLSSETGRSSSGHDAEENDKGDIASGIRQYRKFDLEFSPVPCQLLEAFWNKVGGAQLTHLTLKQVTFPPNNGTLLNNFLRFKYTPNLEYLEGKILIDGARSGGGGTNSTGFVADGGGGGDDDDVKVENFKLRTLKIDYHDEGGFQPRTQSFPLKWKTFLGQFPKLKFFEVGRYLSGEMGEVEGILKAIKEIRDKDKSKLELKSLIWSFNVNWKNREMLESPPLPLPPAIYNLLRETGLLQMDSFRMDFSTEESEELIHGVMSLYAKSLRKLEIYRLSLFETSPTPPFHGMSQLQSLTVSGFPLTNLDLLKTLPNLASLCLWGDLHRECPYAEDLISSTRLTNEEGLVWAFPSLAKFCCNYNVWWTPLDISRLQTLMPALSHLELALTDVTFRRVCQYWPRLEHLSVYGNEVGDEGLVGFRQRANSHYVNYSKPNITSLTYLKSFAIETTGLISSFPKGSFTWHSVVNGLCELPSLKKLLIESDEEFVGRDYVLATIPFAKVMIRGRRLRYCHRTCPGTGELLKYDDP